MDKEIKTEGNETIITSLLRGAEAFLKSLVCDMKGDNPVVSAKRDLEDTFCDYIKTKKDKEKEKIEGGKNGESITRGNGSTDSTI